MINNQFSYFEQMLRLFPDTKERNIKNITFQVTEDCNLRCSYCYQICKTHNKMTFDVAKKFIDYIFDNMYNPEAYINVDNTRGLVIDFIGGEPMLEIELIGEIVDYFEDKFLSCNEEDWLLFHVYNFSTNGTLYFTPKVQKFIEKYGSLVSISVTVDGNKELHDSCRVFADGSGSYDLAHAAAMDQIKHGNLGSKITVSPNNVKYIYEGVKSFVESGFRYVNINCCFEDVWTTEAAKELFNQLIKLSDWITENNLYEQIYIALLSETQYGQIPEQHLNTNWCGVGGNGMVSIDYKGDFYPCLRFMSSSLGPEIKPIKIGNIKDGLGETEKDKETLQLLSECTRNKLSDEKCLKCPIAIGCSWCIGYCYQYYGDLTKKTNFICEAHKLSALATKYLTKVNKDKEAFLSIQLNYSMYENLIDLNTFNSIVEWKEE